MHCKLITLLLSSNLLTSIVLYLFKLAKFIAFVAQLVDVSLFLSFCILWCIPLIAAKRPRSASHQSAASATAADKRHVDTCSIVVAALSSQRAAFQQKLHLRQDVALGLAADLVVDSGCPVPAPTVILARVDASSASPACCSRELGCARHTPCWYYSCPPLRQ